MTAVQRPQQARTRGQLVNYRTESGQEVQNRGTSFRLLLLLPNTAEDPPTTTTEYPGRSAYYYYYYYYLHYQDTLHLQS